MVGKTKFPSWVGGDTFLMFSIHMFHPKICLGKDLSILTILQFFQIEFQNLKPHEMCSIPKWVANHL